MISRLRRTAGEQVAKVNLDALIPRDDFEVSRKQENAPIKKQIQLRELESTEFFFGALRKPDFQRETDDWDSQRVVDLIGTFLNDDLIPAVVLWRNRDLYFVIDGAHRLSALIAWVQDDYGDGSVSQKFFNYNIPNEQKKIAHGTRELAQKRFGTYLQHKDAIAHPAKYSEEIRTRALRLGASLSLELQWVRGESSTNADESFKRINQRSAIISPQEFHLIDTRKKPATIAARAILWRGAGRKYWADKTAEIEELANDIHDRLFSPVIQSPIKSADLPMCGSTYASNVLVTLHEFVSLCVGDSPQDKEMIGKDDADGSATVECLKRTARIVKMMCSNDPSSLGLHPAVYFYSWTGKHQPILLLTIASLMIEYDKAKKLKTFCKSRAVLEDFLVKNRALINQTIRKFGSKNPEYGRLRGFYSGLIGEIESGTKGDDLITALRKNPVYSFLQPDEVPYPTPVPKRYSSRARTGIIISESLDQSPKCPECGAAIPIQAKSIHHKLGVKDGGLATVDNHQITHPYCNSIKN